jgi:hypothetical protein
MTRRVENAPLTRPSGASVTTGGGIGSRLAAVLWRYPRRVLDSD